MQHWWKSIPKMQIKQWVVLWEQFGIPMRKYFFDEACEEFMYNQIYRNRYGDKYAKRDNHFKDSLVNKVDLSSTEFYRQECTLPTELVITSLGEKLFYTQFSAQQLRKFTYVPELFDGIKIGEGLESEVYKYVVSGQDVAVKICTDKKKADIKDLGNNHFLSIPEPNFTRRFGYAPALVNLAEVFPKQCFNLRAAKELLAMQSLMAVEYVPGINVYQLGIVAGLENFDFNNADDFESGQYFMHSNQISPDEVKRLYNELENLRKFIEIIQYLESDKLSGGWVDFYKANFIIESFDPMSRKFGLVVIDQGVEPHINDLANQNEDPGLSEFWNVQHNFDVLESDPLISSALKARGLYKPVEFVR